MRPQTASQLAEVSVCIRTGLWTGNRTACVCKQCVQTVPNRSLDVQQHSVYVLDTGGTCEKMMGARCAMRWK